MVKEDPAEWSEKYDIDEKLSKAADAEVPSSTLGKTCHSFIRSFLFSVLTEVFFRCFPSK